MGKYETGMGDERVWPYVLSFPLDSEKRGLIWSIPQSPVGLKILEKVSVDKRTYQHDLLEKLPYSNKSIIKYLKKKVKAAILEKMDTPADLLEHGPKNVILTKGTKGAIVSADKHHEFSVSPPFRTKFKSVDPTSA